MIGVVLWSDPREGKAVIWCEDHGELAFYRRGDGPACVSIGIDAGDLVSFDVETVRDLRFAHNPQVVECGFYRELPDTLQSEQADVVTPTGNRPTAEVIPLFHSTNEARAKLRELMAKTG